ncbi:MAG: hypothetical protein F4Y16_09185 [Holophagales bacterium]|nr:hypothetical protein [Holophagales bacterium]MYH24279.1 hypothetical protein [Holophagales bacterium]
MARRKDTYVHSVFTAVVLEEAIETVRRLAPTLEEDDSHYITRTVTIDRSQWTYDSDAEFFAACRRSMHDVSYAEEFSLYRGRDEDDLDFRFYSLVNNAGVHIATVEVKSLKRDVIAAVAGVFENHADAARVPEPDPEDQEDGNEPTVFVGHGHNPAWRDLKDHLTDKHGITIEAYEIGARAGHAVRDILQSMLKSCSMALLVMTGDDEVGEHARTRQNVVHEAGLFQGKLGFERAIVLIEEGVESFSNIDGIETIRFEKGSIQSTFGDVVATIRREFPSA